MANSTESGSSEVLSQSDIDSLIATAAEGTQQAIFRADGTRHLKPQAVQIEAFDFRTPIFLAESELRRLRMVQQEFVRTLSARFSAFLRADFSLKMAKLTTLPYAKFIETIQNPSHLTLFKADPLPGIGILEIEPRLAMSMTNRMLGGKGTAGEGNRFLTEIEVALLEEIIQIVTDEWCLQWRAFPDLRSSQLGHETNARFLQTCAKDTIMLVLGIEAAAGETMEHIQIAVPYFMLEPIIKEMQASRRRDIPAAQVKTAQWRPSYSNISVPVIADWQVPGLTVDDVLGLRVGDVLELPRTAIEQTRVRLANAPQFVGRVGSENGRVALQISARTQST